MAWRSLDDIRGRSEALEEIKRMLVQINSVLLEESYHIGAVACVDRVKTLF